MANNTFTSQRTHTRIKFEPLNLTCSLVCLTPQSPVTQTINTLLSPVQYEPDRTLTPTLVLPEVRVIDVNNIFEKGAANKFLSLDTLQWYIDEEPIETVWEEGIDYDILTTEDANRGALKIYKNLNGSESAVLHFTGEFLDWRTGIVYQVESDDMALTCTDKGESTYRCSVDKPLIEYDPLYDDLLVYEHKKGIGEPVIGTREDYLKGHCYDTNVRILLVCGSAEITELPSEIDFKLVDLTTGEELSVGGANSDEIVALSPTNIHFDLRMVERREYDAQFWSGDKMIAHATIGIHRKVTMPTEGYPAFNADLTTGQKMYNNRVLLTLGDRTIEYPELYYGIQWYTQSRTLLGVNDPIAWQRGEYLYAPIEEIGVGTTVNDAYFEVWFDLTEQSASSIMCDETGEVLLDEDDEILID